MAKLTIDLTLREVGRHLESFGFRWWLNTNLEDGGVTVMVDMHPEWHHRAPTAKEMDLFLQLQAEGRTEELFRIVAEGGLSPGERYWKT